MERYYWFMLYGFAFALAAVMLADSLIDVLFYALGLFTSQWIMFAAIEYHIKE